MSETERTFLFQPEGGGQEERIKVNIDKKVKDLLDLYLNGKNLQDAINEFAFMVGAYPLKKDKYYNAQIKHLRFLKPNTIIKVREVDTKMGGGFKYY